MGLGNPGEEYRRTRHNLGFWVIQGLARLWGIPLLRQLGGGKLGVGQAEGVPVGLFLPLQYMNLSGPPVRQALEALRLSPAEMLLIHDDLDLEPGRLRMRPGGSSGGHRGVASVIAALGTEDFPRLRLGIGRPPPGVDPAEYVLAPLTEEEEVFYRSVVDSAIWGCRALLRAGLDVAMGWVNSGFPNADR